MPPLVRLLALGCVWGTSFLLIETALDGGVTPPWLALLRVVLGAAVLWPLALGQGLRPPRDRRLWGRMAVMSVVSNVLPFFLFGWGQERVTSGVASIYNALTPLATLAIAVAVLPEERPTAERVAGFLLTAGGMVLLVGADPRGSTVAGQLACLGAAVSYGAAFNYARRYVVPLGIPVRLVAACQLTCAAVVLGVLAPFFPTRELDLRPGVVASVALLGAVGTGLAFVVYHGLVRDIGATRTSMVTFLLPVVAVTLGVTVLGERVTLRAGIGALVMVAGVAVAEGRLRGRRAVLPPAVDAITPESD